MGMVTFNSLEGIKVINYNSIIRWNIVRWVTNESTWIKVVGGSGVKIDIIPDSQTYMLIRIIFNFMT